MSDRYFDLTMSVRCYLHYLMPFALTFCLAGLGYSLWVGNLNSLVLFSVGVLLSALAIAVGSMKEHFDTTTFETEVYEDPCCCGHPTYADVEEE